MIVAIGVAEAAFWLVLLAGLTTRYVLRRPRAGGVLLLCVPLVDVALVAFVAVDIAHGAAPSQGHALAAVYLGVTVAFGHPLVRWADVRFRFHFAGGPPPTKPTKGSRAYVRSLWTEWFRVVVASLIACGALLVMIAIDGFDVPATQADLTTDPYWGTMAMTAMITVIWFLAGPAFAGRGAAPARSRGPRPR